MTESNSFFAMLFSKKLLSLNQSIMFRKHLQKVEFFACWAIIIFTILNTDESSIRILSALNDQVNITPPASAASPIALYDNQPIIHFFRLSVLTRVVAYLVDLTNAKTKLDGIIPIWLIFHHSGVLVQHVTKAYFLTPKSSRDIILFALASQSSHNTWTKQHSLLLYWSNVLVGVFTCSLIHSAHQENMIATSCFYYSLLVTSFGIVLLVNETISDIMFDAYRDALRVKKLLLNLIKIRTLRC